MGKVGWVGIRFKLQESFRPEGGLQNPGEGTFGGLKVPVWGLQRGKRIGWGNKTQSRGKKSLQKNGGLGKGGFAAFNKREADRVAVAWGRKEKSP